MVQKGDLSEFERGMAVEGLSISEAVDLLRFSKNGLRKKTSSEPVVWKTMQNRFSESTSDLEDDGRQQQNTTECHSRQPRSSV